MKKNPFTAAERFYPVEMSYTVDDIYSLSMDIPKGYKVDEMPKSARVMLNENEGMFEYIISAIVIVFPIAVPFQIIIQSSVNRFLGTPVIYRNYLWYCSTNHFFYRFFFNNRGCTSRHICYSNVSLRLVFFTAPHN